MDILKQELQNKRQSLSGGRKFFNRSKIQQKRRREEESERLSQNQIQNQNQTNGSSSSDEQKLESLNLANEEVIRRLRLLKQPVTLFGESDGDRLDRLNYALNAALFELDDHSDRKRRATDGDQDDVKRMKTNNNNKFCDEDKIVMFFSKLLTEWEQELGEMTETEKMTAKGKLAFATYKQCVNYLNPLFNLCRKMVLRDEIKDALMLVVKCCMKRDYSAAMNHYIGIAIGSSAWPIGVTMVGIHERSAREKIHTNSVAHVMNDETTRKYLTSVKRLITFCERRDIIHEGGLAG